MTVSPHTGSVIDKAAVREVLRQLMSGRQFSEGDLGIEQATNRICGLQRPPSDMEEVALTVCCPYCGRTAGNRCRRGDDPCDAHPSRVRRALEEVSELSTERQWESTRWWRAIDPNDRQVWCESSNEDEVRGAARPLDVIEHLWREVPHEEWRRA